MTKGRTKKEAIRAEYKKLMLQAAERVIIRRGFRSATMDEIAREANFSKATLYKCFNNKGQIILEIILQYIDEIKERLRQIQQSDLTAEEKLKQMILSILDIQTRKENIARVFVQDKSLRDFAHRIFAAARKEDNREFQQALKIFKSKREEIIQSGHQVITEGIEQGKFVPAEPEKLLRYVWALIEGLIHTRYWQEKRISPRDETEQIFGFLMTGIAGKSFRKGATE
ncbi:MAG: TetR family transcriptional regulator [Candidatus Saccharicenans sp.]|nr:TetR family transcriptional regulator [Candidatus Saccharicenans sp.]MDI6849109.1 TetR family transcriptional regulator [Candidatus Saccharicenans sp.]